MKHKSNLFCLFPSGGATVNRLLVVLMFSLVLALTTDALSDVTPSIYLSLSIGSPRRDMTQDLYTRTLSVTAANSYGTVTFHTITRRSHESHTFKPNVNVSGRANTHRSDSSGATAALVGLELN